MKIIMTLSKEIVDEAEAIVIFKKVKELIAIPLDVTMGGYTNGQIDYQDPDGTFEPEEEP